MDGAGERLSGVHNCAGHLFCPLINVLDVSWMLIRSEEWALGEGLISLKNFFLFGALRYSFPLQAFAFPTPDNPVKCVESFSHTQPTCLGKPLDTALSALLWENTGTEWGGGPPPSVGLLCPLSLLSPPWVSSISPSGPAELPPPRVSILSPSDPQAHQILLGTAVFLRCLTKVNV